MKNYLVALIVLVLFETSFAQGQGGGMEFDKVLGPSPTVQSFATFQEVPVNNYTGIPDIKIPLFETETLGSQRKFTLALRYHPSNVKVEQVPGWEGFGWSLMAGGAIYKSVSGDDDENYVNSKGMYGVENPFEEEFFDSYDQFIYNILNFTDDRIKQRNKYLYDVTYLNKYDTSYDLYSLNYGSLSAKFYIKKPGGVHNYDYQIEYLSNDNRIKISVISELIGGAPYIKGFVVTDDNGFVYTFDQKEKTEVITETQTINFVHEPPNMSNSYDTYSSAFWVSEVKDPQGNVLIDFDYNTILEEYKKNNFIQYISEDHPYCTPIDSFAVYTGLMPYNVSNTLYTKVTSQKLSKIDVKGKCKVYFTTETGRMDMENPNVAVRLSQINIKNYENETIQEIELGHSYRSQAQRLILEKVRFFDKNQELSKKYELNYNKIDQLPAFDSKEKDLWGFYNGPNASGTAHNFLPDEKYSTVGLLNKMVIPTGGAYIFDFESNDYAFVASTMLDDFLNRENEQEMVKSLNYKGFQDESNTNVEIFYISNDQDVVFDLEALSFNPNSLIDKAFWSFDIRPVKIDESQANIDNYLPGPFQLSSINENFLLDDIYSGVLPGGRFLKKMNLSNSQNFPSGVSQHNIFFLKKGFYAIKFYQDPEQTIATNGVEYNLEYKFTANTNQYKYNVGGGNRIKSIGYFANAGVSPNFFNDRESYSLNYKPKVEVNFNYRSFEDGSMSSGGVVSIPRNSYPIKNNYLFEIPSKFLKDRRSHEFLVLGDYNLIGGLQTQGSYVGYKNVEVSKVVTEQEVFNSFDIVLHKYKNGVVEYTYSSPIDVPYYININYPFVNEPYPHFKTANLLKQVTKDRANRIQVEENYEYNYTFNEKIYGIKSYYVNGGCEFFSKTIGFGSYYNEYLRGLESGHPQNTCGYPLFLRIIDFMPIKYKYGRADLVTKKTRNFFYNEINSGLQDTVTTTTSFTYHPFNYQMKEKKNFVTKEGKSIEIREVYDYPSRQDPEYYSVDLFNQHRLNEVLSVRTYKNDTLLSVRKNRFGYPICGLGQVITAEGQQDSSSTGAAGLFLKSVELGKYNLASDEITSALIEAGLEERLSYDCYDQFGNPLQIHKPNGVSICYIWGYNNSYPVAKVENATYAEIESVLGNDFDLGNNGLSGTQESDLRNALVFKDAMITTFDYEPLVGVIRQTDYRGYTIYYKYDSQNRLKYIQDTNGNVLKSFDYNYRTVSK